MKQETFKQKRTRWWAALAAVVLAVMSPGVAFAQAAQNNVRQSEFAAASAEFGVPENLLLALSYSVSRWTPNGNSASINGGFGLMGLTLQGAGEQNGKGELATPAKAALNVTTHYTLSEAAAALHVSTKTLQTNEAANIRGAAALLAQYEKRLNGGTLPSAAGDWYGALAEFSGDSNAQTADLFASGVYSVMQSGAQLTTSDGQSLRLDAAPTLQPNKATANALHLNAALPARPDL